VKVQVSGQVLSQSQAARLVIGQARVTSEVFERTFVSNSRFRGWTRVREFERGDGQDDDSYTQHLRAGRVQEEKGVSC